MIVWGGYNGANATNGLNSGGRYNPTTDTWTAVATSGAPAARFDPTAVWTGSEMIVWGGYDGTREFNDGGRYNPATDTWAALPTNAAPPLSISLTITNTVLLSWSFPAVGHSVEQNSDFSTTNWSSLTNAPMVVGSQNQIILSPPNRRGFYRLK